MIIVLIGIILGLLVIALIMLLIHRPSPTPVAGVTTTTPAPATVVAPATTSPPARVTVVTTPCPTTQGSDWLGGFVRFMWRLLQAVFIVVIILAVLGGLYFGGLWAKNWIDNWVRQDDCGTQELVVIRPGIYTTVDINGFNNWSFMPQVSTQVEYLDRYGRPIPVECNGVLVYSVVSPPGIDYKVSASSEFRFLRMSSADPRRGEYSFVIKLE